jgi:hypothetical protein
MLPNGTTVKLVRNSNYGWQAQYVAFHNNEDRSYKILSFRPARGHIPINYYSCAWVDETGKRRGSHTYYLPENDVSPLVVMKLEDWL